MYISRGGISVIHITVSGTEIFGKIDTKLTSGSVGREVTFTFDSKWDGLTKIAVFKVGNDSKSAYLDDKNICEFPWELLTPNKINEPIYIGACGIKDEQIVFPTIYTYIENLKEGVDPNADPSIEHSPTLVEQLVAIAQSAQDVAQSAKETADKINKMAEDGDFKGEDGYTPQRNIDYWTPDDIAEIQNYVDAVILGGEW